MQQIEYVKITEIPLEKMWDFIKDFDNWAHLLNGYQGHQTLNDRESIWEVKGTIGRYQRRTKFHATITEWVQQQKVVFKVDGVNEAVNGFGSVVLSTPNGGNQPTMLSATLGIEARGAFGPVINRILTPWVKIVAEELVEKIIAAVDASQADVHQAAGQADSKLDREQTGHLFLQNDIP